MVRFFWSEIHFRFSRTRSCRIQASMPRPSLSASKPRGASKPQLLLRAASKPYLARPSLSFGIWSQLGHFWGICSSCTRGALQGGLDRKMVSQQQDSGNRDGSFAMPEDEAEVGEEGTMMSPRHACLPRRDCLQ